MAVYNPDQVIVTVAGKAITGFGDGDIIKVRYLEEERAKVYQGVKGDITFAVSAQNAVEFTIPLAQSSPSNDLLLGLYEKLRTGNGGIFPVSVADLSGRAAAFSEAAAVTKMPAFERGKEVKSGEWVIVGSGEIKPLGSE